MSAYTDSLKKLIAEFTKMPGVGPKTAERFAFNILKRSREDARALSEAILKAREGISYCKVCNNFSEGDTCRVCTAPNRDKSLICVVEEPKDVTALENTGTFKGLYHVLMGSLSPLDGIGPADLRIDGLLERIKADHIKEVIIATDSDTEGETTALYLSNLIKPLVAVRITRIGHGIPVGSNLEYADQATLAKALESRRDI